MSDLGYQDEDDEEEEEQEQEQKGPTLDAVDQAIAGIKASVSESTWNKVMSDLKAKTTPAKRDLDKMNPDDLIDEYNEGDVKFSDLPDAVKRRVE